MEPAGLTVGILGIAGLFNTAVDCFEYIQIGRSLGRSFQTSVLELDGARLRLSRWGQSVGLSAELQDTQSLPQFSGSARDVDQAQQVLGQIIELFAEAEGISSKFKTRPGRTAQELVVYDTQRDLEPTALSLHQKMRDLSIKRQHQTGLLQKARWALYEEKHFRRLIEDITSLVNDLVELFPAAQVSQKELCKAEVAEMSTTESLPMLEVVAKNQDKILEEVVTEAINRLTPTSTVSFSGSHNSGFQLAHNTGTISNLRWGGTT